MKHGFTRYLLGLILLLCLRAGGAWGQAPGWAWATSPGGAYISDVKVDASGNVYTTGGSFGSSATFGSITVTGEGAYVAKLNPDGTYAWVTAMIGKGYGWNLAIDHAGNVYVTGLFSSPTATFGSISITRDGPDDSDDFFVAKLNSAGDWQWAIRGGGTRKEEQPYLALDAADNLYFAGSSHSANVTFGNYPSAVSPPGEFIVAKLNLQGDCQWLIRAGRVNATGFEGRCTSMAVDTNGSIYISCMLADYSGASAFGSIVLDESFSMKPVVVKLSPAGVWQWVANAEVSAGAYEYFWGAAFALAADSQGDICVGGWFNGQHLSFGGTRLTVPPNPTDRMAGNLFVAKLSPAGVWKWARSVSTAGSSNCQGLSVDAQDNIYLIGGAVPLTKFGAYSTPTNSAHPNTTYPVGDALVAKLNPAGDWQWVVSAGGLRGGWGRSVAVATGGEVYVTGDFDGPTAITFGNTILSGDNQYSYFLAKLAATGPTIGVWPNPARRTVQVSGATAAVADLINSSGRLVRSTPLTAGAATVDLTGLVPGLYVVRAGAQTRRLVVE